MPAYYVKTPNGLYARFYTVVDNFTHWGLTADDVAQIVRDEGYPESAAAERCLRHADEDRPFPGNSARPRDDGLNRWRQALDMIGMARGADERGKMALAITSFNNRHNPPPPPVEEEDTPATPTRTLWDKLKDEL